MASDERTADLRMDSANLYREEIVSDRGAGTIRVMTPVTRDGAVDPRRKTLYVGEAQILTPVGALPIAFEIAAAVAGRSGGQVRGRRPGGGGAGGERTAADAPRSRFRPGDRGSDAGRRPDSDALSARDGTTSRRARRARRIRAVRRTD
ncbi:MAG: hypothetical protein MZW92_38305 [Comamonadaceae bacterium]|nr:hypothetical protein [Comamonadaceae bacterium]